MARKSSRGTVEICKIACRATSRCSAGISDLWARGARETHTACERGWSRGGRDAPAHWPDRRGLRLAGAHERRQTVQTDTQPRPGSFRAATAPLGMPSGKNEHHPGWKPLQGSANDRIPGWAPSPCRLPGPVPRYGAVFGTDFHRRCPRLKPRSERQIGVRGKVCGAVWFRSSGRRFLESLHECLSSARHVQGEYTT